MKNKLIMLFVCLLVALFTAAQKNRISFSSQTYAGLLTGESGSDPQLQTINGLSWKNWFVGAGTGIDWYYLRSVPVFLSVNRSFLQKQRRSIFLSADAGFNFPWYEKVYYDFPPDDRGRNGGLYWASGVGYKFGVGKSDNAILLQVGYSFKKMNETYTSVYPCFNPPCPEYTEQYNYRLRRLSFRIGWGF